MRIGAISSASLPSFLRLHRLCLAPVGKLLLVLARQAISFGDTLSGQAYLMKSKTSCWLHDGGGMTLNPNIHTRDIDSIPPATKASPPPIRIIPPAT
jgi:hypothetical protein